LSFFHAKFSVTSLPSFQFAAEIPESPEIIAPKTATLLDDVMDDYGYML